MNFTEVLQLPAPPPVFCAVVVADDGPGTTLQTLLDAAWPGLTAARDHLERRVPDLLVDRAGMRLRAAVVPASTTVTWQPRTNRDGKTLSVPIERQVKAWASAEHATVHPDGKVTW
jgi:hypothetical protein